MYRVNDSVLFFYNEISRKDNHPITVHSILIQDHIESEMGPGLYRLRNTQLVRTNNTIIGLSDADLDHVLPGRMKIISDAVFHQCGSLKAAIAFLKTK